MKVSAEVCQGLRELIIKIKDKNFAIKTQYKFLKLAKALDEENAVINEQKQILVDSYAEKDENGNYKTTDDEGIVINPEKLSEFYTKLEEINKMQLDLPDISFTLEELENLELNLGEIYYLESFIKD